MSVSQTEIQSLRDVEHIQNKPAEKDDNSLTILQPGNAVIIPWLLRI
jgi:hypothetical protein